MTDQTELAVQEEEALAPIDERESLKTKLTLLGVPFANNATTEKLRKLVTEHLENLKDEEVAKAETVVNPQEVILEGTKLIRVTVISNDPNKREHQGEMFTIGNSHIGSIRKYVPFGVPWLIPTILYNALKERKFQGFITKRGRDGGQYREPITQRAYNIIVHDLPDAQELEELMKAQALRGD